MSRHNTTCGQAMRDGRDCSPGHEREQHVLPTADLIVHDETEDCPCGPRVTFVTGGKVVTHNSLDGREKEERDVRPA